jgi:FKBP-type peptidyl-prolyl cis-trans isomerase SlyD
MSVQANCVVTLAIEMRLSGGDEVSEGIETMEYLHGGYDNIFPKLEEALEAKVIGDTVELALDPEDAFGEYDAELVRVEDRSQFPEELQVGMNFEGVPGDDDEGDEDDEGVIFTITDIEGNDVVLDGNHPFAGERIWVRAKVTDIREATEEELERGYIEADDFGLEAGEANEGLEQNTTGDDDDLPPSDKPQGRIVH